MTVEHIRETVKKYARAAGFCKQAGMKMVNIHGAHGNLIAQFASPYFNKRTDEYQAVYQEKDGQNYFYVRLENTVLYIRWEDGEAGRVTEILDQIGYPGKDVLKD